jgi:hypothetical protein
MFAVAALAMVFGVSSAALIINTICFMALIVAIYLSWLKVGQDLLPPSEIFSVLLYVFAKLPIYGGLFSKSNAPKWTRTDRKEND